MTAVLYTASSLNIDGYGNSQYVSFLSFLIDKCVCDEIIACYNQTISNVHFLRFAEVACKSAHTLLN